MKLLLTTLILFVSIYTNAQTSIKLEDVAKHVDDSVTVCGKVFRGFYMAKTEAIDKVDKDLLQQIAQAIESVRT